MCRAVWRGGRRRYLEFETNLIGENNKKGMIMLAMMSFLTFKMGIHLPLVRPTPRPCCCYCRTLSYPRLCGWVWPAGLR